MIAAAHSGFGVAAILPVTAAGLFAAVVPAALGNINFTADDRLHIALAGLIKEIRAAKRLP